MLRRLLHGLQQFELVAREGAAGHALRLVALRGVEVPKRKVLVPGGGGEATEEMEKEYREKSEKIQTREQQEVYRGGGESTGGEAGRERNYITILEKYLIDACLIINASVNTKACAGYWLRKSISKCFVPPLIGR